MKRRITPPAALIKTSATSHDKRPGFSIRSWPQHNHSLCPSYTKYDITDEYRHSQVNWCSAFWLEFPAAHPCMTIVEQNKARNERRREQVEWGDDNDPGLNPLRGIWVCKSGHCLVLWLGVVESQAKSPVSKAVADEEWGKRRENVTRTTVHK